MIEAGPVSVNCFDLVQAANTTQDRQRCDLYERHLPARAMPERVEHFDSAKERLLTGDPSILSLDVRKILDMVALGNGVSIEVHAC